MTDAEKLLAELDAEFGKKPKGKRLTFGTKDKGTTKAWGDTTAAQLARMSFTNQADWFTYREMMEANEQSKRMNWSPTWQPEARLIFVTIQHCRSCSRSVEFIGGEYVRFRSERQRATITRRAEVCSDIFHFNREIPELVEEIHQEVGRCPECLRDEQRIDEIWNQIIEQNPQLELDISL